MVMYCCLPTCKSIFKPKSAGGISFHRIPPLSSPLRRKWQDFIKSTNGGNDLSSYKHACLCSKHFTPDCLLSRQRTRLRKDAVPTIVCQPCCYDDAMPCSSCNQDFSRNDAPNSSSSESSVIVESDALTTVPQLQRVKSAPQLIIYPLTLHSAESGRNVQTTGLRFLSLHVSSNSEVDCYDVPKTTSPLTVNRLNEHEEDSHPKNVSLLSDDECLKYTEPQSEHDGYQNNREPQKDGKAKKLRKHVGVNLKSLLTRPQKVVCPMKKVDLDYDIKHKTAAELKREIRELEKALKRVEKLAKTRARKLKTLCQFNTRLEKSISILKAKLKKNMEKDTENELSTDGLEFK